VCSFVIIVLMDKTCKYHKLLLITELVFSDNPKAYVFFVEGVRVMLPASWTGK